MTEIIPLPMKVAIQVTQTISGIIFYNSLNEAVYKDIFKRAIIGVMGQQDISVLMEDIGILSYDVLSSGRRRLVGTDTTTIQVVYKVSSAQEGITSDDMLSAVTDATTGYISFTYIMQQIAASDGVYEFASASSNKVVAEPIASNPTDPNNGSVSNSNSSNANTLVGAIVGCLIGGIALGMIILHAIHFFKKRATNGVTITPTGPAGSSGTYVAAN